MHEHASALRAHSRKTAALVALLLATSGCATTRADASDATPSPERLFLWKVHAAGPATEEATARDPVAWLMGSIHVDRQDRPAFDAAIVRAFESADSLAVELDIAGADSRDVVAATRRLGMYDDGTTLASVVGPELTAQLTATLAKLGAAGMDMTHHRPWLATTVLTLLQADQSAGVTASMGVDAAFLSAARGGVPILSLETASGQLTALASMPEDLQVTALRDALADGESQGQAMGALVDAYHAGDDSSLTTMMQVPEAGDGESAETAPSRAYHDRVFRDRNETMAESIIGLIEAPSSAKRRPFVVVGVGHLVGEHSIVTVLRGRGYVVDRVRPSGSRMPLARRGGSAAAQADSAPGASIPAGRVVEHSVGWPGPVQTVRLDASAGVPDGSEMLRCDHGANSFALQITPIARALAANRKILYESAVSDVAQQLGGAVTEETDVDVSGFPARLATIDLAADKRIMRMLLVYADGQSYALLGSTQAPAEAAQLESIDAVLRSLTLRVEPPQAE